MQRAPQNEAPKPEQFMNSLRQMKMSYQQQSGQMFANVNEVVSKMIDELATQIGLVYQEIAKLQAELKGFKDAQSKTSKKKTSDSVTQK